MRMKRRGEFTEGTIALQVLPVLPDGGNGGLGICLIPKTGPPSVYRVRLHGLPTEDNPGSILWVELDVREAKTICDYIATHLAASTIAIAGSSSSLPRQSPRPEEADGQPAVELLPAVARIPV
jgi:hypothetical protein